jgi:hypothetical protein
MRIAITDHLDGIMTVSDARTGGEVEDAPLDVGADRIARAEGWSWPSRSPCEPTWGNPSQRASALTVRPLHHD